MAERKLFYCLACGQTITSIQVEFWPTCGPDGAMISLRALLIFGFRCWCQCGVQLTLGGIRVAGERDWNDR